MDNQTVNTNYVALQPPYKIIKHGNKIGVQIGTQRVIIAGGNPFRTETHDYPVVAAENRIAALKDNNYHLDGSCDGEVWDNVETKNVSVLCDAGVCLEWQQFIKILWHDHARLGDSRLPINKVFIFNKLISYNKSMMLPLPNLYTLHLRTEKSAESFPYVVRTEKDDVFALNVEWTDNEDDLEKRLLADLIDYLLILSPNRSTNLWHMHYKTEEERLRPLVERLNANPKATSFRKQIMASFTITALPSYEKKETHQKENTTEIPPQTPKIPQSPKVSGQKDEEWDDTFDFIFDKKIKPWEVKRAIDTVESEKTKNRRFFYVSFRILKVLKWFPIDTPESDYLKWINCHFKCGWEKNKNQKKAFLFNLEGTVKEVLDDLHPSEWKDDSLYGKLGKHYRLLAVSFKNVFTMTIVDGKPDGESESYEHLKDRVNFLTGARDYHGALWAPDEAYINDGK